MRRRRRRQQQQRIEHAAVRRTDADRLVRRQPVGHRHLLANQARLRRRPLHDQPRPGMDAGRRAVLRRHAAAREPGRLRHSAAGHGRPRLCTGRLARDAAAGHRPRGCERAERGLRAGHHDADRRPGQAIPVAARQLQRRPDRADQRRRERHLLSGASRAGARQHAGRAARGRPGDRAGRAAARRPRPADRRVRRDARVRRERAGHRRHAARTAGRHAGRVHATVGAVQPDAGWHAGRAEGRRDEVCGGRFVHVAGRHRGQLPGERLHRVEHRHRVQPEGDGRGGNAIRRRGRERFRLVAVLLAADLHDRQRGPDLHVRRYGPPDDAPARAVRAVRREADRGIGRFCSWPVEAGCVSRALRMPRPHGRGDR